MIRPAFPYRDTRDAAPLFMEEAERRVEARRSTMLPYYFERNRDWLIRREAEDMSRPFVQAEYRKWASSIVQAMIARLRLKPLTSEGLRRER